MLTTLLVLILVLAALAAGYRLGHAAGAAYGAFCDNEDHGWTPWSIAELRRRPTTDPHRTLWGRLTKPPLQSRIPAKGRDDDRMLV